MGRTRDFAHDCERADREDGRDGVGHQEVGRRRVVGLTRKLLQLVKYKGHVFLFWVEE